MDQRNLIDLINRIRCRLRFGIEENLIISIQYNRTNDKFREFFIVDIEIRI